jgi:hypothetical protein
MDAPKKWKTPEQMKEDWDAECEQSAGAEEKAEGRGKRG